MKTPGGDFALRAIHSRSVCVDIVADRFIVEGARVIDLATGHTVHLVTSTSSDAAEQVQWAARCARLAALRHRSLAVLVDYGALGRAERFEAWRSDGAWHGCAERSEAVLRAGTAFLRANGLSSGTTHGALCGCLDGQPIYVPPLDAGYERTAEETDAVVEVPGMSVLSRACLTSVGEWLAAPGDVRPRPLALWAPEGAGMDTALLEIARLARTHGVIPLATHYRRADWSALFDGRSLLLIAREASEGWRALLSRSLGAARPHRLLLAGQLEPPGVPLLLLERFSEDVLIGAVRPECWAARHRGRIRTVAVRAAGLPGRFAALLAGERQVVTIVRPGMPGTRAAEPRVVYGELHEQEPAGEEAVLRAWPASGELPRLRERAASAIRHLTRGAHARNNRSLRQVMGALARREDWGYAAHAGLALAGALLDRGLVHEARRVLDTVKTYAERSQETDVLLQATLLAGRIALDSGRLDDAESLLHAAVVSARGLGHEGALVNASLELSRCLFWRGRYDAAIASLAPIDMDKADDAALARVALARSRAAVGLSDVADAIGQATRAQAHAERASQPALVAAACVAAAFAHLAIEDVRAVDADVSRALQAARRARDPIAAFDARWLGAENARRCGRQTAASRLVSRASRLSTDHLPPIVSAKVALLAELLKDDRPEVAMRHARRTGLLALSLLAPVVRDRSVLRVPAGDLVDILHCCQDADDDTTALERLAGRLRSMIRAVAVGFFAEVGGQCVPMAGDGGRIDPAVVARIYALGDVLAPVAGVGVVIGGAPLRYGGRAIGVLAVQWHGGDAEDFAASVGWLTTTAVAAAPALADMRARRLRPATGCPELVGTSAAMEKVRVAVDRAASAPFAVLIEGESGSGKELVARAIHRHGGRRDRMCCTLNCAALPDELVESELFGHARGAFTGAMGERRGVFEEAHGGTLFLDEIGELSPRAQAKVLRAIQEGEVRRVGENHPRKVDVRIVAATNRCLRDEAGAGRFRADLLYRIDVIRIALPPLRERLDDLPVLADHFWREVTARINSHATLGAATLGALARYDWPGNVRELQNVLAALAVRCPRRGVVSSTALPPMFDGGQLTQTLRLEDARRTFDASFVRAALVRTGGHRTRAAEELGVTRQGLTKLMARLALTAARDESD
jgi:DNA-binding NtrC family response regulator